MKWSFPTIKFDIYEKQITSLSVNFYYKMTFSSSSLHDAIFSTQNPEGKMSMFKGRRGMIYELHEFLLCDTRAMRVLFFFFFFFPLSPFIFSHVYQFPLPHNARRWLVQRALKKGHWAWQTQHRRTFSSTFLPSSSSIEFPKVLWLFCRLLNGYFFSLHFVFRRNTYLF